MTKRKNSPGPELETSHYEKIGRTIENVVVSGYADKKRLFLANFLRGTFFGIGSAIGATIAITLIIYTLTLFSEVPFFGRFFENVQQTIEQSEN